MLLVLALVGAGIAVIQQRAAQEQQRIATARQLVAQAESTRNTDPRTALMLGIAAQAIHPTSQTRASLVTTLTTTHYAGTLTDHTSAVSSVAFSPDGRTLATAGDDKTIILWNLTNPNRPTRRGSPLIGHADTVESMVFSRDGRTLATAGDDNEVILWDLTGLNYLRDHATEHACSRTGRGLDRDEWARYIPGLAYQDTCPV